MHFTSESSADGVTQRDFTLDDVPGVLWQPEGLPLGGRPLVLLGHGGGGHKLGLGVVERAGRCVRGRGFAAVALDAPGHGERKRSAQDERFASEIGQLIAAGRPISAWVARHTSALAERAVPEWVAVLDALGERAEAGDGEGLGPVGFWGLSLGSVIGIPLAAAEPRIAVAVFGLTGHGSQTEAAERVGVPVRFLVQWDDQLVPRAGALALFDALGSRQKTLHANTGGHLDVPETELESAERFLTHHLSAGPGAAEAAGVGADADAKRQ
ncbi:alpha/beta hydrolase [Kitasatospora brasiliensis]|uniref:alpha/beta hydrolase n=1 Tax=Kitasatospora brasiliensis TaxID=3058040 RepID=UPI00292F6C74|nr:alpha/beta hydrolase [Kitasatospora sp. K002]